MGIVLVAGWYRMTINTVIATSGASAMATSVASTISLPPGWTP